MTDQKPIIDQKSKPKFEVDNTVWIKAEDDDENDIWLKGKVISRDDTSAKVEYTDNNGKTQTSIFDNEELQLTNMSYMKNLFSQPKTGGKKTKRHRNKSRRKTTRKKTIKRKSNKKRSKK